MIPGGSWWFLVIPSGSWWFLVVHVGSWRFLVVLCFLEIRYYEWDYIWDYD